MHPSECWETKNPAERSKLIGIGDRVENHLPVQWTVCNQERPRSSCCLGNANSTVQSGTGGPAWPQGYATPYDVTLSNKSSGKGGGRGTFVVMVFGCWKGSTHHTQGSPLGVMSWHCLPWREGVT